MANPLQDFEIMLTGNLRYVSDKRRFTETDIQGIALELVREVRDRVIPYYIAQGEEDAVATNQDRVG